MTDSGSAEAAPRPTPAEAFDALYTHSAPFLVRQTFLLTGRRALAREAVERAFQLAWQQWPRVAADGDPAGWVRAAAHEYALSPWRRLNPAHRRREAPTAAEDGPLLGALLALPPPRRRTLLLHDGMRLGLPEVAAETEASTRAAAARLDLARQAVADRLPDLCDPGQLHRALEQLAGREGILPPRVAVVRGGGERRSRHITAAAIALTVLIVGATAVTLETAPTHYEPPLARGVPVPLSDTGAGAGPLAAPPAGPPARSPLQDRLLRAPGHGPYRVHPQSR
ncbi:RNA polymerase subunit sigma-70 [Streptomyces sp. NPDC058045]|uniref:RNA polymerase subunit sigma-70 n=1 Tax=Streptomyces sp. NPDC058045 TaxID=3346311 RepID=UPI0036ED9EF3